MKNLCFDIETTKKIKLGSTLEEFTQRHIRREGERFDMSQDVCYNEILPQLIFYWYKKIKKSIKWSSRNSGTLLQSLFYLWFQQCKIRSQLTKSYLLPILVSERDIEPTVIKKAKQFISFKFGDFELLDIMIFLDGTTSLDFFLKAYKTAETKGFLPYDWFDYPDKMQKTELPPYDAFYRKLRSCNPLEVDHTDYVNLLKSGLTTDQAVVKLKLSKRPPTGIENFEYLKQT